MDYLVALGLGCATAYWRYRDGGSRPRYSNLYALAIAITAGGYAAACSRELSHASAAVLGPAAVATYLLVRGMPGWTRLLPHIDTQGQRRSGMLLGFAAPTLATAIVLSLLGHSLLQLLPFALSGPFVALTYTGLSWIEFRRGSLLVPFTAEQWGRLSYGAIVFGLVLA